MLEEVDLFASFYVACERANGLPRLRVFEFEDAGLATRTPREITFLSRCTARILTSIANLRRRSIATAISRW